MEETFISKCKLYNDDWVVNEAPASHLVWVNLFRRVLFPSVSYSIQQGLSFIFVKWLGGYPLAKA